MLYSEFLEGTGAVDTQESYAEYKRVEEIYMAADTMTKQDAYRMARVVTEKELEKQAKAERKKELAWVKENIIPAAAYIRGMAEKNLNYLNGGGWMFQSPCGNLWELKLERNINCGSMMLYSFWCNGKQVIDQLLPSANFQSYEADWHDKTLAELEALFGYIA